MMKNKYFARLNLICILILGFASVSNAHLTPHLRMRLNTNGCSGCDFNRGGNDGGVKFHAAA